MTGAALEATGGWEAGVKVAEELALEVYCAPNAAQTGFPNGHPNFRGYLANTASALRKALEPHEVVLVVGAPVFMMYPYVEGPYLPSNTQVILLTDDPWEASRMKRGEEHLGTFGVPWKACSRLQSPSGAPWNWRLLLPPRPKEKMDRASPCSPHCVRFPGTTLPRPS